MKGDCSVLAFACNSADLIQLKEKSQVAAIRAGRQSSRSAGVGNKTKDRACLELTERRGFCFVGGKV